MIDLHIHTTNSDGKRTVIETLKKAEELKLNVISITDHETCNSYNELDKIDVKKYFSGKIIPGVEIKCAYNGKIIDILGYGIDTKRMNEWLNEKYKYLTHSIRQEKYLRFQYNKLIGIGAILPNYEEIIWNKDHDWATVVMYKILKSNAENEKIIPRDMWESFEKYKYNYFYNDKSDFYLDKSKDYVQIKEAIEAIHKCNGKAFIAHVFIYDWAKDKKAFINDLISNYKFDGIECYYSKFTLEQIEYIKKVCKNSNLLLSGGSDSHGYPEIEIGIGKGNLEVPDEILDEWYNFKIIQGEEIMDLNIKKATRQSFGEELVNLGRDNNNVVVLDADLSGATKTNIFAKEFPNRFFDMGIAEQDMMGTAAGLSTCGKIPYASTFAVFATGRAYDQIRNSICYPNLNVKICATHAGITVGEDGATHQMLEDINLMRGLPNMKIISPSDDIQTKWAIREAANINGPVYIRLGRAGVPLIYDEKQNFEFGKAITFGDGIDGTVFATGIMVSEALRAKEILEKENINIRVVDIHTIKPIDKETIIKCAKETNKLISIEEHSIIGGLGTAIAEVLVDECPVKLIRMGMEDCFGRSGKAMELLEYYNLTYKDIISRFKS